MTDKLMNCPFCGGSAIHECQDIREYKKPCFYVVCTNCGIQGSSGENDNMAGERWNTRAQPKYKRVYLDEAKIYPRPCDDKNVDVDIYNRAIDDIKAKYGDLYAEVKE